MILGIVCIAIVGLIIYTLIRSSGIRAAYILKNCDGYCEKCRVEKECDFSYFK